MARTRALPSELSPEKVLPVLKTSLLGQVYYYHPSLPSTMNEARRLALLRTGEGAVVLAEEQTAGRGRLQRRWITRPGESLAFSVILRPKTAELSQVPMLASLAVVKAIESTTGLRAAIKWPNDILIKGRKACGILIEGEFQRGELAFAVVGIGLNVSLDPTSTPEIANIATSLAAELGREVSRLEVLVSLLREMEDLYLKVKAGGSVVKEWQGRLETLGKEVEVRGAAGVERGVAEGVNEEGHLLLRRRDGSLVALNAGEVSLSTNY